MRILVCFVVCLSACTTPNPQSCTDGTCTDPRYPYCDADATFQAHPGTCIAVHCTAGAFELCQGPNEALRCNATGNDYELTSCENGCADGAGCVSCVDNSQCANPTPHCDVASHSCARCGTDDDCASAVCDETTGHCADPSSVIYAAPNGDAIGNCGSQLTPCNLERGVARLDQAVTILKLAAGEYVPTADVSLGGGALIHGTGATVHGRILIEDPAQIRIIGLTLQDGNVTGGISCSRTTGGPSLELDRVNVITSFGAVSVFGCAVNIVRSRLAAGDTPIFLTADLATVVTVDRTVLEHYGTGQGRGIYSDGRIRVTNSILRNLSPPVEHPGGLQDQTLIAYSTFIDSPVLCLSNLNAIYRNNIMYVASGDAIRDPTGDNCSYSNSVLSSQSQLPTRSVVVNIADPRLKDLLNGDYHLQSNSPAINAAVGIPGVITDFDGTPRPTGNQSDSGAFEYKP